MTHYTTPWYAGLSSMRRPDAMPPERLQDLVTRYKTLSRRERQILYALATGISAQDIAGNSQVAVSTIRSQIHSL